MKTKEKKIEQGRVAICNRMKRKGRHKRVAPRDLYVLGNTGRAKLGWWNP
jgi:hypothetical protein